MNPESRNDDNDSLLELTEHVSDIGVSLSMVRDTEDVVRQPAEWMQPVDDRILEIFREYGNLTPAAVEKFGGPSSSHSSRRCKRLADYGLLERIVTGLYTITEDGEAYLDEDLDASELDPLDDSD